MLFTTALSTTRRKITTSFVAGLLGLTLTAGSCSGTEEEKAREKVQSTKAQGQTLEKTNLETKRKREENPNAIGYLYLMNFGQIVGYYVTKGKISSSGSQATPEQDNFWTCRSSHGCQPIVVDGPQDDGSYGGHDPGIFFFTADGTMTVTSLDYVYSSRPLPVNAPKLGGQ